MNKRRIYSSITLDMTKPLPEGKFQIISAIYADFSGPVAEGKGSGTTQTAERQQAAFNKTLMDTFTTQFNSQQGVLNFLKGKLMPMVNKPTGYAQDALNAMRTSATDTLSGNYQNAQRALQNNLNQKNGGSDLPAGTDQQLQAALFGAEASDKSAAQNNITLQNENLKQSNLWNAVNGLNGITAQENPLGYAGAANSGSSAVASLSQANTQANDSGFLGHLGTSLGEGLGSSLGKTLGGASKLSTFLCWVASAIYGGMFVPETVAIRSYLLGDFSRTWYGRPLVNLYAKHGQWISRQPALVWLLKPLFSLALRKATQEKN
jgi:hypothetical protein